MEKLFYSTFDSPVGTLYLIANNTHLIFLDTKKDPLLRKLTQKENEVLQKTKKELREYFQGKRKKFTIPLNPEGTEFQKIVWKELLKINFGEVISYKEEAIRLKKPNASRAVGNANGKNPIPIIIPCHRVITSSHLLGGYSGDIKIKKYLLKLEGHQLKDEKVYSK